jgi:two-component system response regulator PilR (NtrC family)
MTPIARRPVPASILIVDAESAIRDIFRRCLEDDGYRVSTAATGEEAIARLRDDAYDLIISDIILPGMTGLELLSRVGALVPRPAVILITAYATVDSAVEALRSGASDYIRKPFKLDDVKLRVARLVASAPAEREPDVAALNRLIGDSPPMKRLRARIVAVADTPSTVLLTGESGSGKELVARALHEASPRRGSRFIAVNCGAIPETLFESHLFGHARGAFTGAVRDQRGLFIAADGGTLFLDEVGELPLALQVKLLRAIEDREVWAMGATAPVSVDIRLIASTNRRLDEEVTAGRFRADLFYRLNVVHLRLPTLRDRLEDVPCLVEHFIRRLNARLGMDVTGLTEAALQVLTRQPWRGNVRELEHVIESAMVLGKRGVISIDHLSSDLQDSAGPAASPERLKDAVREFERQRVLQTLARTNFDKKEAARLLGVSLTSLYRKMGVA